MGTRRAGAKAATLGREAGTYRSGVPCLLTVYAEPVHRAPHPPTNKHSRGLRLRTEGNRGGGLRPCMDRRGAIVAGWPSSHTTNRWQVYNHTQWCHAATDLDVRLPCSSSPVCSLRGGNGGVRQAGVWHCACVCTGPLVGRGTHITIAHHLQGPRRGMTSSDVLDDPHGHDQDATLLAAVAHGLVQLHNL